MQHSRANINYKATFGEYSSNMYFSSAVKLPILEYSVNKLKSSFLLSKSTFKTLTSAVRAQVEYFATRNF